MPRSHRVVVLAYEGLCTFEFGIVVEAFALPRPELTVPWYRFAVCSLEQGPVHALGGVTVKADGGLDTLRRADTIVIPGWRNADERPPEVVLSALRRAYKRGARLVSICSGVFVLAAAGLLEGKRAITHWRYAERLAARFPTVRVEPDVLYLDEGRVLTSAGSAAGIDLCLHIIRKDFGAEIANQVAKRLVVPPHRDGGQSQYVTAAVPTNPTHGVARLLEWAQANLHRDLTVDSLAQHARMSARSFARHFLAETGTTPHRWLIHQRLLAAQRQLETTDDSVERVAETVGLQTAATLRQHFQRRFRTSPSAYRKRLQRCLDKVVNRCRDRGIVELLSLGRQDQSMLQLRRYRSSDLDVVWALHTVAVEDIGVSAPDQYFADLKHVEATFLIDGEFVVGEYGGRIVAMGGLKRTSTVRAEITRMRVHPEFQGRGFGRAVLEHLETRAAELGYRTLHLDTAVEQDDAQQFYVRNGYRRTGSGTKEGFAVVYFQKVLQAETEEEAETDN